MSKVMLQWQAYKADIWRVLAGLELFSAVNFPATRAVPYIPTIGATHYYYYYYYRIIPLLASQMMAQSG